MARRAGLDHAIILQRAAEIVDAEGLDELSIAGLAAGLGVRPPSLYNHIESLESLRRELALLGARELTQRLTRSAVGMRGAEGLHAVGTAYLAYAQAHPGLYEAIRRAPDPGDHDLIAASEEILGILRAVLAPYQLDEVAAIHAIRTLRALTDGFISLQASGGFGIPVEVSESYLYALRLLIAGLEAEHAHRAENARDTSHTQPSSVQSREFASEE